MYFYIDHRLTNLSYIPHRELGGGGGGKYMQRQGNSTSHPLPGPLKVPRVPHGEQGQLLEEQLRGSQKLRSRLHWRLYNRTKGLQKLLARFLESKYDKQYSICPRRSDPFYKVSYYIKWFTTSYIVYVHHYSRTDTIVHKNGCST